MKLSKETIEILKSFKTINPQFKCVPGKQVRIASQPGNVIGVAEVKEEFPKEFAIYDLNNFFDTLSLFDDPELEFEDTHLNIVDATAKKDYQYCAPNIPKWINDIKGMAPVVTFELNDKVLPRILKAAAVDGHKDVIFSGKKGGPGYIRVTDLNSNAKGKKANEFSIKLIDNCDATFDFIFMESCLNLFPGRYKVEFNKATISQFTNLDHPIKYWIAINKDSKYEG